MYIFLVGHFRPKMFIPDIIKRATTDQAEGLIRPIYRVSMTVHWTISATAWAKHNYNKKVTGSIQICWWPPHFIL